ncbi:hypothetical protein B0H13DRAFT_1885398 [Mycena leptocephala]|nr:hypothetical protein B0H13DRAFT_1885398 [Mycena leptocephala]
MPLHRTRISTLDMEDEGGTDEEETIQALGASLNFLVPLLPYTRFYISTRHPQEQKQKAPIKRQGKKEVDQEVTVYRGHTAIGAKIAESPVQPAAPTTVPAPAHAPAPAPAHPAHDPLTAPATYAATADPHRPPSPTTPDIHTRERTLLTPPLLSNPSSPPRPTTPARGQRIVIRFDLNPGHQPTQRSPATLFDEINAALQSDKYAQTPLGAVRWTKHGNLVLFPSTTSTAQYLQQRKADIWTVIRPLLGFPGNHKRPLFERDDVWHSVVTHGVPMMAEDRPESYTIQDIITYLNPDRELVGEIKAFSVLCRPHDLKSRRVARGERGLLLRSQMQSNTLRWRRRDVTPH